MIKEIKNRLDSGFESVAKDNVIKKLEKEGIDYRDLPLNDFNDLVKREKEILEYDAKKIGTGIGIGIGISLLLGV